ncbi:hypothetical protein AOQ84DRAFT_309841 [Glonium stellatum]|uniref:Sucrase n=1 Tax=Glonium stellatum TaxID=574774 RepID=A0A8E2FAZ5_9PEZI|nr:hypothetical protein AOQ84DRAFT_309841 [Glonium stellatum]
MSTPPSASKPLPTSFNPYKMTSKLKNLYYRLTPTSSTTALPTTGFTKAPAASSLFPQTDPTADGEECLHDCASCTIKYPNKWSIDEDEELYGHVKGWSTHLIVATGKTDWDEKGSIMEAVDHSKVKPTNGRLMLSASDMPLPEHNTESTAVLLLPAFTILENVTPANVPDLITNYVNSGPTNTSPLSSTALPPPAASTSEPQSEPAPTSVPASVPAIKARPCPHKYLILLCSQKTRDARCGQSAPLLRREFERHLRPLGLYRDLHDERPGGVGIYFISHVGGHKFAANVMIYRKEIAAAASADKPVPNGTGEAAGADGEGERGGKASEDIQGQAAQCIWLARVKPEDCENIIRYTVLQGKVVKPERQLRGGFDRGKQLVSW